MANISGGLCILLACMLLLLPLPWLLAAVLAAAWHELWHYLAICILTGRKTNVHLFSFGGRMPLPPMSRGRELICTLAGPMGGLTLLLFAKWLPRTAVCAVFQSLYNLLPVYPMDGGRALQCILTLLLPPPQARKIQRAIEAALTFCLLLLAIYGSVALRLGLMPILMAVFLLLRMKFAKMPCKLSGKRVQ